jgi:hypothetical protein
MSGMAGMGRMGGAVAERKGTDVRKVNRAEDRKKQEDEASKVKGPSFFDPYFDIVQVTVYGQARFFVPPPPADPAQEPSPGETAAAAVSPAAPGPDAKTAASPSSAPPAPDSEAKASAPAVEDAAAKTEGSPDDATKSTAPPNEEAAAKKDDGPPQADKSTAPSPAPKSETEGATPKS